MEQIPLNPGYKFEHFVVGPSNRLAQAASLAVVESPGYAFNPLFLHGSVGLGKTHLLQAVAHEALRRHANSAILYLSCETFTNHFIAAVEKGDLEAFRNRYRHVDFLLIDDIHHLANKEGTQEEFFHTFNTLYNAGKQIVLTSDSPPKEIPSLEERLVSRFKWGLVACMESPHFETRVAILRKKAALHGYEFPEEVIQYLAERLQTNVREMEGAIVKIVAYASLTGERITLALAREAVRDIVKPPETPVTMDDILSIVTGSYNVRLSDLQSKKRSKSVSLPRQLCMYLARKMTRYSLEEIGGYFGGRDHTTVMYAEQRIERLAESDPGFRSSLENLISDLRKD
ncbi:MAG: chromosomal replication initiator protein DnaA [Planctomycetes bacterium]|jgi:chromosomal replication initiator protein|nr:chromosomal replication initiator protein DnaA [Planctomycetota bacterium]